MSLNSQPSWQRFQDSYYRFPEIGLSMDLSRIDFSESFFDSMKDAIQRGFIHMEELEKGGIANPDENRMVGHYWLRTSKLAPTKTIQSEIEQVLVDIKNFVGKVHDGSIQGTQGFFHNVLIIGIGGSALGPQFVGHALGNPKGDKMRMFFFDNTDPDGMDRTLDGIGREELGRTLCLVISKSGGTKETRNGMLEAERAYRAKGLKFGAHAVAVTGYGSELYRYAESNGWLKMFPMWDWVGGRTSEMSAVGLLPGYLQGLDMDGLLEGARDCDAVTRRVELFRNPAALLALSWYHAGDGKGAKDMVILPYKDRLELLSKYLQQLIMESLGKELDLNGNRVCQGIAVYGNKGSTDQHAYIQQLREGVPNFFVTFIEVLKDRSGDPFEVEDGVTSGDYLSGFFLGTRRALYENGRQSLTLTVEEVSSKSVGALIALYERAVGLYAYLINVNAYHQPGVEAGKKAAVSVVTWQGKVLAYLRERHGTTIHLSKIIEEIGAGEEAETVFKICEHLSSNGNPSYPWRIERKTGNGPFDVSYTYLP